MSWLKLNDSLNKVKGQITTFAQEVLAEGIIEEPCSPVQELSEAKEKIDELNNLCATQNNELTTLRRQIAEYQQTIKAPIEVPSTSKAHLPESHATLEDSWFWDPDNNVSSTSSSSKKGDDNDSPTGTDMITIPLEVPTGDSVFDKLHRQIGDKETKFKKLALENAILNEKLAQVSSENKELNENIEELDKQHEDAVEELLHVKKDLQEKLQKAQNELNKNGDLKDELELLNKKYSNIEVSYIGSCKDNVILKASLEKLEEELKKVVVENVDNLARIEIEVKEKSDLLSQHEKIQEQLSKFSEENKKLLIEIKAKSEEEFVALPNEDFEEMKAKLSNEKEELKKELENVSIEKQKVFEDFEALKEDNSLLQIKFQEIKSNYDVLMNKDSQEAKSDEVSQLEQEINELKNELRSVIIDNSVQLDAKEKEFSIQIDSLVAQKKKLEEEVNDPNKISFSKINEMCKKYINVDLKSHEHLEEALSSSRDLAARVSALERKLIESNEDINFVKLENSKIQHEKDNLQADLVHYEIECNNLRKNNDILLSELENFKSNKLETINENAEDSVVILEKQLEDCSNLNRNLEDEYLQVQMKLEEYQSDKNELENKIKGLEEELAQKDFDCKKLQKVSEELENEKCNLIFEINENKSNEAENALKNEVEEYNSQIGSLKSQLSAMSEDHANLVNKLQNLQKNSVENIQKSETTIAEHKRTIELKEIHIKQLYDDLLKANDQIEALKLKKEDKFAVLEKEKSDLEAQVTKLGEEIEVLKAQLGSIQVLTQEKQNLIALITTKHNENIQYHNEIQRLNQALHSAIEKSETKGCEECPKIKEKLELIEEKTKKLEDFEKMTDQIQFLREKSDILTNNLMIEQNNQKVLNQEKLELVEQKNDLTKDLDRLRQHLLDIEEAHTQETVELQQKFTEAKNKLLGLEEEAKKSSNAYTSASIRANQHAETIQAQYMLLQSQRDELSAKLSVAEDRESKNLASLTNLQCALEQFQINKDRDIELATNAIRKELLVAGQKENSLKTEKQQLQQQLLDAKNGLLAAARISDQLEISQVKMASLKNELEKSNEKYVLLEKKLKENEASQADKVEKTLVKNLLIGYIVAPNQNDKTQILKLISAVLTLDQNECNKIGLNKSSGGWLNSILGAGSSGNYNKESLTEAFVKFLEKESQPRSNPGGPTLLNIMNTPTTSPLTPITASSSSTSAITSDLNQNPVAVQPILLNESMLNQSFPPQRNSSAILKDILSDSS